MIWQSYHYYLIIYTYIYIYCSCDYEVGTDSTLNSSDQYRQPGRLWYDIHKKTSNKSSPYITRAKTSVIDSCNSGYNTPMSSPHLNRAQRNDVFAASNTSSKLQNNAELKALSRSQNKQLDNTYHSWMGEKLYRCTRDGSYLNSGLSDINFNSRIKSPINNRLLQLNPNISALYTNRYNYSNNNTQCVRNVESDIHHSSS